MLLQLARLFVLLPVGLAFEHRRRVQEDVLEAVIDIVFPECEPRDLLVVNEALPAVAGRRRRRLLALGNVDGHVLGPNAVLPP